MAFNGLAGPFAGLATAVWLGWLAVLLYVDAAVSPGGTGLIYVASSSRLSYALSREGYVWSPLHWLNSKRVPIVGIVLTFVVGVILFLPFPGWQKFVGFITSATVLSYALVPPALIGMAVISWLGQYDGRDTIPFWWGHRRRRLVQPRGVRVGAFSSARARANTGADRRSDR
ncbi:MAG: APC family permease [Actinobacteria bacterium]|nr:MAG: APC family permease [Actinomycetota bacterium]